MYTAPVNLRTVASVGHKLVNHGNAYTLGLLLTLLKAQQIKHMVNCHMDYIVGYAVTALQGFSSL